MDQKKLEGLQHQPLCIGWKEIEVLTKLLSALNKPTSVAEMETNVSLLLLAVLAITPVQEQDEEMVLAGRCVPLSFVEFLLLKFDKPHPISSLWCADFVYTKSCKDGRELFILKIRDESGNEVSDVVLNKYASLLNLHLIPNKILISRQLSPAEADAVLRQHMTGLKDETIKGHVYLLGLLRDKQLGTDPR